MVTGLSASRRTRMAAVVLTAGAIFLLAANTYQRRNTRHYDYEWQRICSNPPYSQLEDGMTSAEVRQILGEPTRISPVFGPQSVTPSRPLLVEEWDYNYPDGGLTVIYFGRDGRAVTHSCGPV